MRHIYTVDKYILNIIGDMVELFEGYGTVPVRGTHKLSQYQM